MPLREGDVVVARRSLGMLDPVRSGTPGTVRQVHEFAGYTIQFQGGRTLHAVDEGDIGRVVDLGPWKAPRRSWWLAPSEPRNPVTTARDAPPAKDTSHSLGVRDLAVRVVLAVPILAVLIYALTQLG